MIIDGKQLQCDKCEVPCGGVDQPGLYKIQDEDGEHWYCKRHYDGVKDYERVKRYQERQALSTEHLTRNVL